MRIMRLAYLLRGDLSEIVLLWALYQGWNVISRPSRSVEATALLTYTSLVHVEPGNYLSSSSG